MIRITRQGFGTGASNALQQCRDAMVEDVDSLRGTASTGAHRRGQAYRNPQVRGGLRDVDAGTLPKCAWCERFLDGVTVSESTEHYRPVAPYWWLQCDADNLLLTCKDCNESKGSAFPGAASFPLFAGVPRLRVGEQPPGREIAAGGRPGWLLIDPADPGDLDPAAVIRFRALASSPHEVIAFSVEADRRNDRRATETIRIAGLNRISTVLDARRNHYSRVMRPRIRRFNSATSATDARRALDAIAFRCRRDQPLASMCWHIAHREIDQSRLTAFGMALPPRP